MSLTITRRLVGGLLKVAFATLERVAPGPGSVLATRIWLTPPHTSPAAPGPTGGRRSTVPVNGSTVAVEEWGEGPAVFLLHGWGRTRRDFDAFVPPLVEAGFRVIAVEASGHGDSAPGPQGGRRSLLPEFIDALSAVTDRAGPAYAIVAHSAGAASAARAVLDGLRTEHLVLLAPMGNLLDYTAVLRPTLGFGRRIDAGFHRRLEQRSGRPLTDFDVAEGVAGRVDLPPMLVVHDQTDRRNPYSDGVRIAAAWPGAELCPTTGLGHVRMLRDPAVVEAVVTFLRK
ncbi:alpha/beta fold hydrolase [Actinoplanes sp. NPDC049265]|uniref:alpha/beta fold hydrolase n=1 Tax=Actinoplanes sp. NPDC049265 TaxID=3363902 RepID=UPI003718D531